MPVETIKCRECGSADVTEFKAGSYVCGHCESVFKHVAPAGTIVACEIDGCGVLAVGRCVSCGRAFCGTHGSGSSCRACYVELVDKQRRARAAEEIAQRKQAAAAAAAAADREQQAKTDTLARIRSMDEPFARLVTLMRSLFTIRDSEGSVWWPLGFDGSLLTQVCPEIWPTPPPFSGGEVVVRCDAQAVARWFAARALKAGLNPDSQTTWTTSRRTLTGRAKISDGPPEAAWAFPGGGMRRGDHYVPAYIFRDGRLKVHLGPGDSDRPHSLRACVLIRMAELLEL